MPTPAMLTVLRMMENLPETTQGQIADHLRDYIAELQDEADWDELFAGTQAQIESAARRAKHQIQEGQATPLDSDSL